MVIILVSIAISQDILLEGYSWKDQILKLIILASLSWVAWKKYSNETLHKIIVLLLLAAFVGSFAVLDYTGIHFSFFFYKGTLSTTGFAICGWSDAY